MRLLNKAAITTIIVLLYILIILIIGEIGKGFKVQEVDYYPGKYQWKCTTDAECFAEEQACLASGACVRQR